MAKKTTSLKTRLWAWALYDFANSPFTTTITTVVFNVYFAQVVVKGSAPVKFLGATLYGDTIWAMLIATATLLAGITSPFLGAIADIIKSKKTLMLGFAFIGSLATSALVISKPGTLLLSSILFVIASYSFSSSLAFYNAFLNDLSDDSNIASISGFGWALGYIGGGLCLALNLAMIQKPMFFGITTDNHFNVRLTFFVVGIWWFVFTMPFLFLVNSEQPILTKRNMKAIFTQAFLKVLDTLKTARNLRKNQFRYLISYILYNDGIETVIVMSSLFAAQVLFFKPDEIIMCFLMIQFVAFFGALIFGKIGDRAGNKKTLIITLCIWIAILFWALFMTQKAEFWAAGAVIAMVLGGSQALSRSLFGKIIPKGQEAQFYGFLTLSGKISATLGPLAYAVSRQLTGSPRIAIFSMLLFFILGLLLLSGVKEDESLC
ncbi:MFS transporter [Elusimicrobiota bacterium]